jgi:hypothetical protein
MMYRRVDVRTKVYLSLGLDASDWSASRPGRFDFSTQCIGGWVGPRACLYNAERIQTPIPRASSQ